MIPGNGGRFINGKFVNMAKGKNKKNNLICPARAFGVAVTACRSCVWDGGSTGAKCTTYFNLWDNERKELLKTNG